MMKALVTGGAGFIGSHIADRFIGDGFDVVVVDNLSSGRRKNINAKAGFVRMDICSSKLSGVFRKERPECVVHQAAQINVRKSIEDPVFDANVNILGSLNLLECSRKFNVKKIVYASSGGAIYGEPQYLPADEKHPINPLCPYGASKHAVEHYLEMYHTLYGIDYTSLRYANVYGPRQDPYGEAGVVAIFTKKLLAGEKPVIFGDGRQTRDFVYVGDVAEANVSAVKKKTKSKAFNVGAGVETSVNEITFKLKELLNSNVEPAHGPEVKGEVRRISLDVSLAKKELGWKPKVSLDAGLNKTIEYFKENE